MGRRGQHGEGEPEPGQLWDVVQPGTDAHAVDGGALGEYAALLWRHGSDAAAQAFPAVAAHLATGCTACRTDLDEILAFLAADDSSDGRR